MDTTRGPPVSTVTFVKPCSIEWCSRYANPEVSAKGSTFSSCCGKCSRGGWGHIRECDERQFNARAQVLEMQAIMQWLITDADARDVAEHEVASVSTTMHPSEASAADQPDSEMEPEPVLEEQCLVREARAMTTKVSNQHGMVQR